MHSQPGRSALAVALVTVGFVAAYAGVLARLVHTWRVDENYSHAFVVVPVVAWLIWQRRGRFATARPRPAAIGLGLVVASVAVQIVGVLGAELFLARLSMLGVIAGTVVYVLGWEHLEVLAFPLALLLLVVPIPTILFNQVAFPLQLLASRVGEAGLWLAGVPVLREGNLITLPHTTLEVAEACSGIRSLMSLLALAILYGHFADARIAARIALAAAAVPIAIAVNGLRIAGTGLLAQAFGTGAAQGFFHAFSGWLMFVGALVLLAGVEWLLRIASRNEGTRNRESGIRTTDSVASVPES